LHTLPNLDTYLQETVLRDRVVMPFLRGVAIVQYHLLAETPDRPVTDRAAPADRTA
jgi:hypothetical protein